MRIRIPNSYAYLGDDQHEFRNNCVVGEEQGHHQAGGEGHHHGHHQGSLGLNREVSFSFTIRSFRREVCRHVRSKAL
jgi:hypothetical protein